MSQSQPESVTKPQPLAQLAQFLTQSYPDSAETHKLRPSSVAGKMSCNGHREPSARIRAKRAALILSEAENDDDDEDEDEESENSEDRDFIDNDEVEEGDLHKNLQAQLSISERVDNLKGRLANCARARDIRKDYFTFKRPPAAAAEEGAEGADAESLPEAPQQPKIEVQASAPKKKGKVTNKSKVHDPEYHPGTSLWSATHVKVKADVHAAVTIEAWKSWSEKCVAACGRLERGEKEDHLHLQAWFETYSGTTQADINAMKAAWRDQFGCIPAGDYKSSANPFVGNQKAKWMTGYVGKTLQNKAMEPGTTDMMCKGEQFNDEYIQGCIASYLRDCPKNPNATKATFSRSNLLLYALNFKNKFIQHIQPVPSLGRIVQLMIKSGKYVPATNFLAQGYPLDREKAEKLWRVLDKTDNCTKLNVCECLFTNNDAMLTPVLDVSYLGARPENCPFPYSSDVDYEGDPYGDNMTYEDFVQLNREMNPNAHVVHAEDDIP